MAALRLPKHRLLREVSALRAPSLRGPGETPAPQLQPIPRLARAFAFASHSRDFLGTTFYIHILGAQNLIILRALFEPWAAF